MLSSVNITKFQSRQSGTESSRYLYSSPRNIALGNLLKRNVHYYNASKLKFSPHQSCDQVGAITMSAKLVLALLCLSLSGLDLPLASGFCFHASGGVGEYHWPCPDTIGRKQWHNGAG